MFKTYMTRLVIGAVLALPLFSGLLKFFGYSDGGAA